MIRSRGEAEIGVAQASEIVPVAGAQLVGPLPGEFAIEWGGEEQSSSLPRTWRALIAAARTARFSDPVKIKIGFRSTFERYSIFKVWLTRG